MVPRQLFYGLVISDFVCVCVFLKKNSFMSFSTFLNLPFPGVLNDITMEIPPLQEIKHSFCLYFLVPGEYTLAAAALINDANDILRTRARTISADEPIFCRGPPYHVRVLGTA